MKVLYIGCYRDLTGWGQAATDYILAMDSAGIDVVCKPLKLNKNLAAIPDRLIELESKDSSGAEVCIQHVLPHYMDFNGRFKKNIALYATETSHFKGSSWASRINQLDEAWVINNEMVEASRNSGVNIPIKVIPHASDVSKFSSSPTPLDIPQIQGKFTFYFIGDFTLRKNLGALLKAYHLEFSNNEDVSLIIKTSQYGTPELECVEKVRKICSEIKLNLKIYPSLEQYKEELIIAHRLSEEEMQGLHAACDCFVMPSYGEAWCIPAFDAMGFGKTPICTDDGGMSDFVGRGEEAGGILVKGTTEPVFGMLETFEDIYTSKEDWVRIDVRSLQSSMRKIYEESKKNSKSHQNMKSAGLKQAKKYSYESIGNLIKQELENA